MNRLFLLLLPILFLSLIISGCASTEPARFYTLRSLDNVVAGEAAVRDAGGARVGIGPLRLPGHLDRQQIVTYTGGNELRLAEFDRWAEPLDKNFLRVLVENMSVLLNTGRIYAYPWKRSASVDYQIAIEVIRFDIVSGKEAYLVARWSIYSGDGSVILLEKKSSFNAATCSEDLHSAVTALNKTLADFSREVAMAIKGLPVHRDRL